MPVPRPSHAPVGCQHGSSTSPCGGHSLTSPSAGAPANSPGNIAAATPGLSIVDFVIAATAQLLEAHLAPANVRHYPMFKGLAPPYSEATLGELVRRGVRVDRS
jgi:hypothetical protein